MFSPGFRARKDRTSCLEHGGISSQPLGLREPPAAPTQPVSRQAPVWEPEATSSVTWITFTSHFHAFSGRFPLTPGGGGVSLENCLHPPPLLDGDSISSEDETVAVLRLLRNTSTNIQAALTSELAATFRKILVQLPHFINNETESQRGKSE